MRREEKRRGDENPPVCTFKTPPCVRSGRLRVYRQQARMSWTFGPVAGTHGDVLTVHTEAFRTYTQGGFPRAKLHQHHMYTHRKTTHHTPHRHTHTRTTNTTTCSRQHANTTQPHTTPHAHANTTQPHTTPHAHTTHTKQHIPHTTAHFY